MKKIGRYEVVEELGRGAMGVVYKASDPTIGRLIAIKVLSLEPTTEKGVPGARDIFMREARAAGRLSHPGIVTIHDALEDQETGSSYIVMEFVPGRTLEDILMSGPAPEVEKALDIIGQVAEALEYAHRQQIIHRDLKPANILLDEYGRAKITDFGIAKIAAREGALRTVAIMGTPSYMSPEQVTGVEIDARSDLFSLGIILFLLLTGQKPFSGDTAAVMFKIVYEDPVAPSQLNPRLSPAQDYLVLRCLAKDRTKRYSNAREFLDDLDDVQHAGAPRSESKLPIAELRTGERTLIRRPPIPGLEPQPAVGAGQKQTRLAVGIAVGMVLLAVLAGLGIWNFRQRNSTPAPQAAAQVTEPAGSALPTSPAREGRTSSSGKKSTRAQGVLRPHPDQKSSGRPGAALTTAAAGPPPAVKPAITPPPPVEPAATRPTAGSKVFHLVCKHELKEATLTILSGTQPIFEGSLKGKKKGGFLGIKGGFAGMLSRPITVPAGARRLTARVVSKDGSVDLTNTVSAAPPSASSTTLQVAVSADRITLSWETALPSRR